ncbi:G5 domain-containing protein [Micromonospora sp. HNM0581]|uniref:G5 domain-containing protein n=1 Tax=Micromonospora sp. HNM0581 TaxID=2716341 RepID=UPI00321678F3
MTVVDGVQTGRKLVSSVVTKEAVTEVVAEGTKPASRCDPNYSPCVPIASGVDCAGGSGNGPRHPTPPPRHPHCASYRHRYRKLSTGAWSIRYGPL